MDGPQAAGAPAPALLRRQGWEVVDAGGPAEALQHYRPGAFAAVLCDERLALSDPPRLLERIRRQDAGTYVILIGDEPDGGALDRGLEAGADDFVSRPLEPPRLLARLRSAERLHALRDEVDRKALRLSESNRRLEAANRRMRRELEAAARVQQAMLPASRFQVPGLRVAWRLRPCEELAGDLLNCIRLDEHHVAMYVLDVSGHGVSSALLSVQVSRLMSPLLSDASILKEPLKEPPWYRVVEPARVLERLNEMFPLDLDLRQYFTIVYALLHLRSGRLRVVSAGHPGPIHVPAGGPAQEIPCCGTPIGFVDRPRFDERELTLGAGDRLWLYSDGMTEAENADGRLLTAEGLRHAIGLQAARPLAEAVAHLTSVVELWCRPGAPADDCSLLAIERL